MKPLATIAAAAAMLAVASGLTACGSNDADSPAGNATDLAFAQQMVAHHQTAIDMATVAQRRAQSPFIRKLAQNIASSQQGEIAVLNATADDMTDAGVQPADLGISDDMAGMNMNDQALASADPFDRKFVDMMIGHHQGAIRMARVELEDGSSPALTQLAQQIIDAQSQEIEAMNAFRTRTYGSASPAGGIPANHEDDSSSMPGMDHGE
jgi:uncharacterized protein (DUF305 family)